MNSQREQLLTHLRNYVGSTAKINDNMKIYHDLGIGGDDAFDLLDHVSADFKLDFSEMKFSDYFPNESEAFFEHIGRIIGFKGQRKPLTVDHLLRVIEKGQWFEPNKDVGAG